MNSVVNHSGQKIMGSCNRMDIAGKVEINFFSWNDHSFSPASRPSLYSEDRPKGRLTQGKTGFLAEAAQSIRQTDGGSGLAFSGRGRRHSRHHDQFALRAFLPIGLKIDLGLISSV